MQLINKTFKSFYYHRLLFRLKKLFWKLKFTHAFLIKNNKEIRYVSYIVKEKRFHEDFDTFDLVRYRYIEAHALNIMNTDIMKNNYLVDQPEGIVIIYIGKIKTKIIDNY